MKRFSLEDFFKKTGNIYEAVVIMAKRARQITDEQRILIDREREVAPVIIEPKESEEYDDVEIDREALHRSYKKFPKPTTLAIQEMLEGYLKWERMSQTEEK